MSGYNIRMFKRNWLGICFLLIILSLSVVAPSNSNMDVSLARIDNSSLDTFLATPTFTFTSYKDAYGKNEFQKAIDGEADAKYPLFIHLDLDSDNSFVVNGVTYYVFHDRSAVVSVGFDGGFNISTSSSQLSVGSYLNSGGRSDPVFRYADSFARNGFQKWDDYVTFNLGGGDTISYAFYFDYVDNALHLKYLNAPNRNMASVA